MDESRTAMVRVTNRHRQNSKQRAHIIYSEWLTNSIQYLVVTNSIHCKRVTNRHRQRRNSKKWAQIIFSRKPLRQWPQARRPQHQARHETPFFCFFFENEFVITPQTYMYTNIHICFVMQMQHQACHQIPHFRLLWSKPLFLWKMSLHLPHVHIYIQIWMYVDICTQICIYSTDISPRIVTNFTEYVTNFTYPKMRPCGSGAKCRALQGVAMCCSVWQCVALCCSVSERICHELYIHKNAHTHSYMSRTHFHICHELYIPKNAAVREWCKIPCVAGCCNMWQCVAVCCIVL